MSIIINSTRKAFIVLPSFLESNIQATHRLVDHCGRLCSIKDFQSVKSLVRQIDSPIARLYEAISNNDYKQPESFIVENVPDVYRSRMIYQVATAFRHCGDLPMAGRLIKEASSMAQKYNDIVYIYQTSREQAVLSSLSGDRRRALEVLKNTFPLARCIYSRRPVLYFDFLNSLAFELMEAGELEAAEYFIGIALASPFSHLYDGWLETAVEIKEKKEKRASRSIISGTLIDYDNVLDFAGARVAQPSQSQASKQIATVSSLMEHREMPKKNQSENLQPKQKPSADDSRLDERNILHSFIADLDTPAEQIDELMEVMRKFKGKQAEQK